MISTKLGSFVCHKILFSKSHSYYSKSGWGPWALPMHRRSKTWSFLLDGLLHLNPKRLEVTPRIAQEMYFTSD